VEIRKRIGEVPGDQDRLQRLVPRLCPIVGDTNEIDDREPFFLEVCQEFEFAIGERRRELFEGEVDAFVFDEADHVTVSASWETNGEFIRPRIERCRPWQVEELGLGPR